MTKIRYAPNTKLPKADILVFPLHKNHSFPQLLEELDQALQGGIRYNMEQEKFDGSKGQVVSITTNGHSSIPKIILLGIGNLSHLCSAKMYELGKQLLLHIPHKKDILLAIDTAHMEENLEWENLILGLRLECWRFTKYLTTQPPYTFEVVCLCKDPNKVKQIPYQEALYEGVTLAKNLSVEPANVMFPKAFADQCLELQNDGIVVTALNKPKLEQIGCHALLGVGSGSPHSPYLVSMEWKGNPASEETIALVGKGVCYDSGGINLKTENQVEMKWDKAAAGSVVGVMKTIAKLKLPLNVVGIVGLVENMPDGASIKPGDVISTMAGKTVEVVDTDCEGRLVLADCLWYAQMHFRPGVIVDLGTLSPDVCASLAGEYAGLFCDDEALTKQLVKAGNITGEKVWQLPRGEVFAKQIESNVADMKNSGIYRFGDGAAAAEFLACFVKEDVSWAHIDIAGVAWADDCRTQTKTVTGFGVRLLVEWLQGLRG